MEAALQTLSDAELDVVAAGALFSVKGVSIVGKTTAVAVVGKGVIATRGGTVAIDQSVTSTGVEIVTVL